MSTVLLPFECGAVLTIVKSMDNLSKIVGRIERRLLVTGKSAAAASKEAGLSASAIYNLQRGARGKIPVKSGNASTFARLAPVLQTSMSWLTEGIGPENPLEEQRTIPVWGVVGAGGAVTRFHESAGEIDRIAAPDGSNESTGAVEIIGDSLGTLFDHWFAVYDEVRHPPTPDLLNRLCIIELVDGRVMIKRLKKGRGKRFTLESNYEPPIYDVEVKWAARVKNMVPR